MRMFSPFPSAGQVPAPSSETAQPQKEQPEKGGELQDLKDQIAAMQRKLDTLS
jgi:polyhydroxyalkanoate synthesis regulator protein